MSEREDGRRAALLRLLDGPTSTRHHDLAASAVIRSMLREGLIDYVRSSDGYPLLALTLTPAGLAAARAIKEREKGG